MGNDLVEAMDILKRLPEKGVKKALEQLREIKAESEREEADAVPDCPQCGEANVVRNGHRRGKQAFVCRSCGKSFFRTEKTALFNSHYGEAVWKQVIRDTVRRAQWLMTYSNCYVTERIEVKQYIIHRRADYSKYELIDLSILFPTNTFSIDTAIGK